MAKRILVISKSRDIIKEDINKVIEMFKSGTTLIKKKETTKHFEPLDLSLHKTGILWWVSSDYASFIQNLGYFAAMQEEGPKHVIEYTLDSLDSISIERCLSQCTILGDGLKLGRNQLYVKFTLGSMDDVKAATDLVKKIHTDCGYITRMQVNFSSEGLTNLQRVEIASSLSALGAKNGILVSSCSTELFERKNIWVSCEPCISGNIAGGILGGVKMVRVKNVYNKPGCLCHKYIDVLGCGKEFREGIDTIKKSSDELEKMEVKQDNKSNKTKDKTNKDTKTERKPKNTKAQINPDDIEL